MKLVFALIVVVALWGVWNWVGRVDARHLMQEQHRITECQSMGGHPVLYWHRGYGAWLLESCKL